MSIIRPLSSTVIAAIAAGEVVERPAIVVKELIENSLDAGATKIAISASLGGSADITVSDDGFGMDDEDLKLSITRHTTSKIFAIDDLNTLQSFGFRGEALASIASVSIMTIQSKMSSAEIGYQISVRHGHIGEVIPVGMPNGTTITVEHLFAEQPARRKFLKSSAIELRRIIEVVQAAALSHPEVSFAFTHNQKMILFVPKKQTLLERAVHLFKQSPQTLLHVDAHFQNLRIFGLVGTPQLAHQLKQKQYLFVNHRPVHHNALTAVVKKTFGALLDPRTQPVFILHLELLPSVIDVNIHPRKELVRFVDEARILENIAQAVDQALKQQDLSFHYTPSPPELAMLHDDNKASVPMSNLLKSVTDAWQVTPPAQTEVMQIDNTYLLTATPPGLMIIDQHAAHERILYQQFLTTFRTQQLQQATSVLDPAMVIECSAIEAQLLREHLPTLAKIGFEVEPFGEHSFKISQVPLLYVGHNLQQLFAELLEDFAGDGHPVSLDSVSQRTIAYLACRSAVKAGDYLSQHQRQALITQLATTEQRFTCPHGRPTTMIFTISDLEKMFRRR